MSLQSRNVNDEETAKILKESKRRIDAIAAIHQKLYQNETGLIDFDEYIKVLVKELSYMYASEKKVKTNDNKQNVFLIIYAYRKTTLML